MCVCESALLGLFCCFAFCVCFLLCAFRISWLPELFFGVVGVAFGSIDPTSVRSQLPTEPLTQTLSPPATTGLKLLACVCTSRQMSHATVTVIESKNEANLYYVTESNEKEWSCITSLSWGLDTGFIITKKTQVSTSLPHEYDWQPFCQSYSDSWDVETQIFHLSGRDSWGGIQEVIIIKWFCIKLAIQVQNEFHSISE